MNNRNIIKKLKNFSSYDHHNKEITIMGTRIIEQVAGSNFSSKFINDKIEFIDACNKTNSENLEDPLEVIVRDQIDPELFNWNHREFGEYTIFPSNEKLKRKLIISYLHQGDNTNRKSLVIIPGFSDDSFAWTVGRINQFYNKLREKYSDIYIFDNSSIGKIPFELSSLGIPQPMTYEEIVKIYIDLFHKIGFSEPIDILGRSAGGGVAIMLSLNQPITRINNLYLASAGFDFDYMKSRIKGSIKRNVVISHSVNDKKIRMEDSDGCFNLYSLYFSAGFNPELVIVRTVSDADGKKGWLNHRIHPELIEKIVQSS